MLTPVIVTCPLYPSLSTFGMIFLVQFLLPQVPYIENPERYILGYRMVVLLKFGFKRVDLSAFAGDPLGTATGLIVVALVLLLLTWWALLGRNFR